jgi:hypothetical protein
MLGTGFALGGPAGTLLVAANLGLSYGIKAMNLGLEIQKRLDRLETQKYIGSIEQTRFVRNNTTEMIR